MSDHYMVQYGGYSGEFAPRNNFGALYTQPFRYQTGRGLAGFFGGLYRMFRPLITSGLKSIAGQGLATGADILSNYDPEKQNLSELMSTKGREGLTNLKRKAVQKVLNMAQMGNGLVDRRLTMPIKRPRLNSMHQFYDYPPTVHRQSGLAGLDSSSLRVRRRPRTVNRSRSKTFKKHKKSRKIDKTIGTRKSKKSHTKNKKILDIFG